MRLKPRVAILGNSGMVGRELVRRLEEDEIYLGLFNRSNLDVRNDSDKLAKLFAGYDAVINAIGFTNVDQAELNVNECNLVNSDFPGRAAIAARMVGSRFVHISTDYVFSSKNKQPIKVSEQTSPISAYGMSKASGEQKVLESGGEASIVRSAWLYSEFGNCFPKTIARKIEEQGQIRVVSDQHGQPTWARDLAEYIWQLARLPALPPIAHAAAAGDTTWANFAGEVAINLGKTPADCIQEVSSLEFNSLARRPEWSILESDINGVKPIGDWRERWREAAPSVLKEFL